MNRDSECDAVITDVDSDEMAETLAAVNLNYKRQTFSIRNYTFGVYFNIVASNMTVAGGWIPYVPLFFSNSTDTVTLYL